MMQSSSNKLKMQTLVCSGEAVELIESVRMKVKNESYTVYQPYSTEDTIAGAQVSCERLLKFEPSSALKWISR